uniref:Ketol-acid reductoisomerase n=1 Tax=Candidatus Kentrum sp. LFY TaxID=2126342 RepID=A0A450X4V1_9GAMM|nr:MAG: ketol-acid reductoisomerase [Candidatus Kentron sp. LFY]
MAKIDFGGVVEEVVTREEFPVTKARDVLENETIAVIGYGVQGPAQALNMKENGFRVIVGQAKQFQKDWDRAVADGWVPGETLFDMVDAAKRGTVIQMLVSDAAQKAIWPTIEPCLDEGDALYFSHGFSIVYKDQTGVIPPSDCDVLLVAPKGSGLNVRRNFLSGAGINSSFGVFQDYTGRARERAIALGIAIGSGYLFPTTFENEVYSDLTGERGILMGALAGVMEAQYQTLRENGHSPSEAFNETVEELTQSLIRLVDENGMDWMYSNCSATAQRGALDWRPKFKAATLPVFKELYRRVKDGTETARVIDACGAADYQQTLGTELSELGNSEMWRTGKATRNLRPKEVAKTITGDTKGVGGRATN